MLPETERVEERKRAEKLKKIPLDSRAVSDVFMLAMGAYTPLDGFMGHDDWHGSCVDMKMRNGVFWPIPITLPVDKNIADSIHDRGRGRARRRGDRRTFSPSWRCMRNIRSTSDSRPSTSTAPPTRSIPASRRSWHQGDVNLAGPVMVLSEGEYPVKYPDLYIRPAAVAGHVS